MSNLRGVIQNFIDIWKHGNTDKYFLHKDLQQLKDFEDALEEFIIELLKRLENDKS
ncbi:MAG: hypothetical protein GY853_16475 [PVC group bacterium]|nr:hypothetical protein [PVC group bacterium]